LRLERRRQRAAFFLEVLGRVHAQRTARAREPRTDAAHGFTERVRRNVADPFRDLSLEVGPRDVAAGQVVAARRTGGKAPLAMADLVGGVRAALDEIQSGLLAAARERRERNSIRGVTRERMVEFFKGPGGFAYGGFCGQERCEQEIKAELGATVRVLPDPEFCSPSAPTQCLWCNGPSVTEAVWAKAY